MGAENIGTVEFRRTFAFDKEFRYLLVPRLGAIGAAIATALIWHSYWALVVGMVVGRTLRILFSYVVHPFRPRLSLAAWRVLAGYSAWTWLLGIAALLRERADTIVVGRMLQTAEVGLYSVGFEFAALGFAEIVEGLQRPAFSAFVAARHDGIPLREPLLRLTGAIALLAMPVGVGLSLVAEPMIRLIAGERWLPSVPVIQLVSLCGPVVVVGALSRTRFNVLGEFRTLGGITFVSGVVRVAAMVEAIRVAGLVGAAVVAASSLALEGGLFTAVAWRREHVTLGAGLLVVVRPAAAAAAMAGSLWAAGLGWTRLPGLSSGSVALALVAGVAIGAAVYVATLALLWIAAGRPDGAERDALAIARRVLRLSRP